MCASFKVQIIQRAWHLENRVCCSGDLVWLNMPESALDTGKPSAYTIIRPSRAPLECLFHLSVKGHQKERTRGLFWVFSQCNNKKPTFFDERSCVMSLLVLPAPMTGGRLLPLEGQHFSQAASVDTVGFPSCHRDSHGLPRLLGHPWVHAWQPTQPPTHPNRWGGRGWWCWGSPTG